MRLGVLDIGSNTVRLVIYGGPARAPAVLHNEKVTARLGKAVAETGLLSEKARNAALASLRRAWGLSAWHTMGPKLRLGT